ncbi:MAG: hypothetical protein JWM27_3490 [Gemmatimonadetes bacterium]|nr:hypothetical protein [Gemmatimonadota bacterium]
MPSPPPPHAPLRDVRAPASPSAREAVSRVAGILLPALACAAGVGLVLARTPFGARITPDSVSYLATARHLLQGRGFATYNGDAYTEWPPLFPLAIAAGTALLGDAHRAATYINALAFGGLAAAASAWTWRRTRSPLTAAAVCAACLRSAPLVLVAVYAWSEPLYLLLSLLALFALAAYDAQPRRARLVLAALLSSAAMLTRYVGVAGIATGGLLILLRPGSTWPRRTVDALLFGAIGIAGNVLWSLRNYHVAGNLTGGRKTAHIPLSHNVALLLGTLGGWVLPAESADGMRIAAGAACVAAGIALAVLAGRMRDVRPALRPLVPPATYVVLYAALLLASATLTPIDPVGDRLAVPLLAPALVAAACAAHALLARVRARRPRWALKLAAAGVFAVWVALATGEDAEAAVIQDPAEEAAARDWRQSDVGRWLHAHSLPGHVFSNDPWTLHMMTGRAVRLGPIVPRDRPALPTAAALQDYEDYLGDGPVWFVWLDRDPDGYPRTLVALAQRVALLPVARLGDGVVYRLTDEEDPLPRGGCLAGRPGERMCLAAVPRARIEKLTPR